MHFLNPMLCNAIPQSETILMDKWYLVAKNSDCDRLPTTFLFQSNDLCTVCRGVFFKHNV